MAMKSLSVRKPVSVVFALSICFSVLFCALVFLLDPLLAKFPHLPDQGPAWYFWKLPAPEFWSGITAWAGYGIHQAAIWWIIALARREKPHPDSVSRLNIAALVVNGSFMFLHLLQTHLFYDGLAQYVPIWTSQYSVIGMLSIIIVLLAPVRGIFWGRKLRIQDAITGFVRKYHGFYVSWALVYTFWFHPMEGDLPILLGFFYMFLLFIQMSMFNTRLHFSVPWITTNEVFVGVHGTAIAIMSGQAIWTMFLFGFLFMFVFTQMHGFKFSLKGKITILALYVCGIAIAYWFRGYAKLYELTFIPVILYAIAFGLIAIVWVMQAIVRKAGGLTMRVRR